MSEPLGSSGGRRWRVPAPRSRDARLRGIFVSVLLGAVAVAIGACEMPSAQTEGALRPIEPRPSWTTVYAEMETCVGLPGDFDRVEWFAAERIVTRDGIERSGIWLVAEGRPHGIALSERVLTRSEKLVDKVVQHEAIHEILQLGDHGDPVWCQCDPGPERFKQC